MSQSTTTLSKSQRLIALEGKIQSGLQTFVEVGEALMEMRLSSKENTYFLPMF